MPDLLTPEQFAQSIKAKYPDYASVPDAELAQRMLTKYPEYRDRVQTAPPPDQSGDIILDNIKLAGEVAKGVVKGAVGTIEGGGQLIRNALHLPPSNQDPFAVKIPINPTPSNPAQQVGKTLEHIGEFYIPSTVLGKAKMAMATGHGILDALVGAGLEGTSAAAVQSAQQGSTEGAGKTAALTAGTTLGSQVAFKALGWLGERVENALVKATNADFKNGFNVSNIFKYKLGGSLSQTYDKADAKINDLGRQLRAAVSTAAPGQTPTVDVLGTLADTAKDLSTNSARTFGSNAEIERAVNKLLDDPMFQTLAKNGTVDLATAQQVKQAIGDLGAWLHDPSGRVVRDPDSKGMETVANALYSKLNAVIAQKSGGAYADINKQLSEILPIRQAVIRRIPVEQRANVLSMGDLLGFSTGTWGLALANRILKSGEAANAMVNVSQAANPSAALAGRTTGALFSQTKQ
jgi:hypothetical protein